MNLIEKLRSLWKGKSQSEVRDFSEKLRLKYGFEKYLYATSEGLPIIGNFENYEELSAKIPEILKGLSIIDPSKSRYIIKTPTGIYLLDVVDDDVILFAKVLREPSPEKIEKLELETRKEFNL